MCVYDAGCTLYLLYFYSNRGCRHVILNERSANIAFVFAKLLTEYDFTSIFVIVRQLVKRAKYNEFQYEISKTFDLVLFMNVCYRAQLVLKLQVNINPALTQKRL